MTPLLAALLAAIVCASPAASAARAYVPRASVRMPGLAPTFGRVSLGAGSLNPHGLTASLAPALSAASLAPAPALTPVAAPSVVPAASAGEAAADAPQAEASASPAAGALDALKALSVPADGPRWVEHGGFDGGRRRKGKDGGEAVFVVNDEGVTVNGRAARYYREVRRLVDLYSGRLDLSESLDVMDDSYGDVWAKVTAVDNIAKAQDFSKENTHLEETLLWVDGVLRDGRRTVAVNTHRVYFHRAKNPRSEIEEGIRRVDGYLKDAEGYFRRGGKAEHALGRLDQAVLVFDARGYQEIKDHLRMREKELAARHGDRIKFQFLDEIAKVPRGVEQTRAELNALIARHQGKGLQKIVEGVIYSRYVGLLLELKTMEHYHKRGYKVLQGGRELFDEKGMYVTELDVVAKSPEGEVLLVEAKSSRVVLPPDEILADKVIRKLETYKRHKAQLDVMIGEPFTQVVFAVDVGNQLELIPWLQSKEEELSRRYGFPVSFLFLESGPDNEGGRKRR